MPFLDTALKVVRLLSALVWLVVAVVTLWGTWVTFRELGPYLQTLTAVVRGPQSLPGVSPGLPGSASLQDLQGLIRTPRVGQ